MSELPKKPLRVAVYLRVSTDDQIERYGLDLQAAAIEAYIKSRPRLEDFSEQMYIVKTYRDEGVSGQEDFRERPAFANLMEDVLNAPEGASPFDIVAVYKIDRFARRLKILLDIIEFFDEHDIKFVSVTESIDTSTPF